MDKELCAEIVFPCDDLSRYQKKKIGKKKENEKNIWIRHSSLGRKERKEVVWLRKVWAKLLMLWDWVDNFVFWFDVFSGCYTNPFSRIFAPHGQIFPYLIVITLAPLQPLKRPLDWYCVYDLKWRKLSSLWQAYSKNCRNFVEFERYIVYP